MKIRLIFSEACAGSKSIAQTRSFTAKYAVNYPRFLKNVRISGTSATASFGPQYQKLRYMLFVLTGVNAAKPKNKCLFIRRFSI